MGKSRKSVMKSVKSVADKALPAVNTSLNTVGSTAKNVARASIPIVEKGVSAVYGTMATGLDLGIKGVKSVSGRMSKRRSRSLAGGRRRCRTRRRHRRRH